MRMPARPVRQLRVPALAARQGGQLQAAKVLFDRSRLPQRGEAAPRCSRALTRSAAEPPSSVGGRRRGCCATEALGTRRLANFRQLATERFGGSRQSRPDGTRELCERRDGLVLAQLAARVRFGIVEHLEAQLRACLR
eukprot:6104843-Pleurochrysis_carterae.AAC.2